MQLTDKEYINRVLTLLNENDIDMEYSASRVREYIKELYPVVWRRSVELFPRVWFETKPYCYIPMYFHVRLNEKGEYNMPTLDLEYSDIIARWKSDKDRSGGVVYRIKNYHHIDSESGIGFFVLPKDFLKLAAFRIKGWKYEITDANLSNQHIEFKQSNKYTRGTPWRPVGVIREASIVSPLELGVYEHGLLYEIKENVDAKKIYKSLEDIKEYLHTEFIDNGFLSPIINVHELEELRMNRAKVLWYYSLKEDAAVAEHELEVFRYIADVNELPDKQEVSVDLMEPLIYMGSIVTLEGIELWEEAKMLEDKLSLLLLGV